MDDGFDWWAGLRGVTYVEGVGWLPWLVTYMVGGTGEAVEAIPTDAIPSKDRDEALRAAQRARYDRGRGWLVGPEPRQC